MLNEFRARFKARRAEIFIYYFRRTDYDYRMFTRSILSVLLILSFVPAAFAQTTEKQATDNKEKPKLVTEELRKEAVEFLRETSAEVGTLRTLENRISFSSEMAGLMWLYDEKEAAAMYQTVITDFKQLFAGYDAQLTALGIKPSENEYMGGMFGGNDDDKSRLTRKFYKAMGVRQQIAMSLAEHDATLAFDFFYDTLAIITNADLRKSVEQRDSYFESQFIKQLAKKDAGKAAELGRRSLAKGVNWQHLDLLRQLYEKDAEKGAEFAAAVVGKFKEDKVSAANLSNLTSFMNMGISNAESLKKESGKKPMFTNQNLRDLAEILAQGVLEKKPTDEFDVNSYLMMVEKYAPARAVQIRAKFASKIKAKTTVVAETDTPEFSIKSVPTEISPEVLAENKKRKEQQDAMENVMRLGKKELPKEEREKIIVQARKIINGMGNRQEKIMAISMLASQVAAAGDRELAVEIMKDAQTLVNPNPKNFRDFMEIWFLASAFAATDPDKAFPLLEDAIFRLNDTLGAFVKVGEFIDVSGEMIDDGEVQVGSFGGTMINGLTRELGIANPMIRNLAIADFKKTTALTNKFDRTEVRILAKMLVLRAVLGDETNDAKPEVVTEDPEV